MEKVVLYSEWRSHCRLFHLFVSYVYRFIPAYRCLIRSALALDLVGLRELGTLLSNMLPKDEGMKAMEYSQQ